jgi:hypothetical protein
MSMVQTHPNPRHRRKQMKRSRSVCTKALKEGHDSVSSGRPGCQNGRRHPIVIHKHIPVASLPPGNLQPGLHLYRRSVRQTLIDAAAVPSGLCRQRLYSQKQEHNRWRMCNQVLQQLSSSFGLCHEAGNLRGWTLLQAPDCKHGLGSKIKVGVCAMDKKVSNSMPLVEVPPSNAHAAVKNLNANLSTLRVSFYTLDTNHPIVS